MARNPAKVAGWREVQEVQEGSPGHPPIQKSRTPANLLGRCSSQNLLFCDQIDGCPALLRHRWIGLANASPTAPNPADGARSREEPPPRLAGFAVCDEEYPTSGWRWRDEPIEWVEDLPPAAIASGEGVNMWRQNIVILEDGRVALFYNSGPYGQEQLYMQWGTGA